MSFSTVIVIITNFYTVFFFKKVLQPFDQKIFSIICFNKKVLQLFALLSPQSLHQWELNLLRIKKSFLGSRSISVIAQANSSDIKELVVTIHTLHILPSLYRLLFLLFLVRLSRNHYLYVGIFHMTVFIHEIFQQAITYSLFTFRYCYLQVSIKLIISLHVSSFMLLVYSTVKLRHFEIMLEQCCWFLRNDSKWQIQMY